MYSRAGEEEKERSEDQRELKYGNQEETHRKKVKRKEKDALD